MDQTKKALIAQYKERRSVGGVFAIKNTGTGRLLLDATTDLQGSKNRFAFSQQTGSCINIKLQKDWNDQGADAFAFEVLEELTQSETQTAEEFTADIKVLKELWLEKLASEDWY